MYVCVYISKKKRSYEGLIGARHGLLAKKFNPRFRGLSCRCDHGRSVFSVDPAGWWYAAFLCAA